MYLKVGLIVKPHGVNGILRIYPLTDDCTRFLKLKTVYLDGPEGMLPQKVEQAAVHNGMAHLKLSGVTDRDAAERLRGQYLYIARKDAVALPENSYFISDLIGCEVVDNQGRVYGKVRDVLQTGANDVYVVQGEKELLMPAIKKLVKEVDVANRRIVLEKSAVAEVVPDAD